MEYREFGRSLHRLVLLLITTVLVTGVDSRAEETYIAQGGVYREAFVCLPGILLPCSIPPKDPLGRVEVVIRDKNARVVKRLETNRAGVFRTRLRPGLYTFSTGSLGAGGSSQRVKIIDRAVKRITLYRKV